MEKNKLAKNSSLLVTTPAILLWLVLMLLSALAGYMVLSGLFLFFLLLFSFVRYWASKAMDGVSLEVGCSRLRLFGQRARITREATARCCSLSAACEMLSPS